MAMVCLNERHTFGAPGLPSLRVDKQAKLKAEPPVTLPAHSPPSLIPLGPRTCCSLHSEGVSQTRPLGRLLLLLQVCACVTVEMKKEE